MTLYISRNSIYKGGFTHSFLRKKSCRFFGLFSLAAFLAVFFSTKTLWPSVCCRSMWSYEVNTNSLLIYILNRNAACSRGGDFFSAVFPQAFLQEKKQKNECLNKKKGHKKLCVKKALQEAPLEIERTCHIWLVIFRQYFSHVLKPSQHPQYSSLY